MDDAAVIGFVGALAGALVGAGGTYLATVGAARRQGQDRARAVLAAVGASMRSEAASHNQAQVEATLRSLAAFRALLGRADCSGADADQPAQLHLRLTIPTLPQPAWTGTLTADVGFVPPTVYLKLSELEALAAHISGIAAQTLDPALTFHALLRELPGDFTPRQLAAAPQRAALATTLDRLTVLLEILLDLYHQHTALRRELLALLPS